MLAHRGIKLNRQCCVLIQSDSRKVMVDFTLIQINISYIINHSQARGGCV